MMRIELEKTIEINSSRKWKILKIRRNNSQKLKRQRKRAMETVVKNTDLPKK